MLARHLNPRPDVAPAAPATAAAAEIADASSAPDFNPGVLQALPMVADGSEPEFAPRMLQMFERASQELLDGIDAASAAEQTEQLQRRLHMLKSSSAQIGAVALSQAAARMEAALRAQAPLQPHWIPELHHLHQRARLAWQGSLPPAPTPSASAPESATRPRREAQA
jgi:HPt (histidine-containing phosphotransfer) domain-containing protein